MQKSTSSVNWDDPRYFLEVARTERASGAAKRLGVDHTTVARRVRELETALSTVLFEKSRAGLRADRRGAASACLRRRRRDNRAVRQRTVRRGRFLAFGPRESGDH
jgi:DNA-binding transcriptional LysR family regulator